jgi:hypothetical protein
LVTDNPLLYSFVFRKHIQSARLHIMEKAFRWLISVARIYTGVNGINSSTVEHRENGTEANTCLIGEEIEEIG